MEGGGCIGTSRTVTMGMGLRASTASARLAPRPWLHQHDDPHHNWHKPHGTSITLHPTTTALRPLTPHLCYPEEQGDEE